MPLAVEVEGTKDDIQFDNELAEWLLPVNHRFRPLSEYSDFRERYIKAIKDFFDPELCNYIASGAKHLPRRVLDRKPIPQNYRVRRVGMRPETLTLIRKLIILCHQIDGREIGESSAYNEAKRVGALLLQVVERSELGVLLSYRK